MILLSSTTRDWEDGFFCHVSFKLVGDEVIYFHPLFCLLNVNDNIATMKEESLLW